MRLHIESGLSAAEEKTTTTKSICSRKGKMYDSNRKDFLSCGIVRNDSDTYIANVFLTVAEKYVCKRRVHKGICKYGSFSSQILFWQAKY